MLHTPSFQTKHWKLLMQITEVTGPALIYYIIPLNCWSSMQNTSHTACKMTWGWIGLVPGLWLSLPSWASIPYPQFLQCKQLVKHRQECVTYLMIQHDLLYEIRSPIQRQCHHLSWKFCPWSEITNAGPATECFDFESASTGCCLLYKQLLSCTAGCQCVWCTGVEQCHKTLSVAIATQALTYTGHIT